MAHTVVITGASGMLGRELLPRLCAAPQVERVFVLVRSGLPEFTHKKIEVLAGDVTLAGCGLSLSCRSIIHAETTIFIHGAALTSFSSPLEALRQVNVIGTENLLAVVKHCRTLRSLCHLSTVYVAGRRTGAIREDEFAHACGFVNAYEQSKYEAEELLQAQAHRLPISVIRLSTILGDSRDGAVGKLGAIHHALRLFFHSLAPFVPGTPQSLVDLMPVDYAAQCVAALALESFPDGTWHVCGGSESLELEEMLELSLQLFCRYRPAWRKRLIEKPAIVDLKTFELFVKSVEETGESMLKDSMALLKHFAPQLSYPKRFEDKKTCLLLEQRGVVRPAIRDYYPKVIRFLLENNWQAAPCAQALCEKSG